MTAVHRLHHHRAAEPAMMAPMDDRSQRGGKVLALPQAPDAIEVLSQRNGFHISDIGISEIPYRRIAE